jgi:cephalosporin-C deacetylase-like acetyl esterase
MRLTSIQTLALIIFTTAHSQPLYADVKKVQTPDWSLASCPASIIDSRKTLSLDSAKLEELSFKGCHGNLINAYLVSPLSKKIKKHPAILYVHWYEPHANNSNRDEFLNEAKDMAQRGVVSLLVSTFWSVPGGSYQQRRWQDDYENTLHQTQDLLHALNLLRSFTEVDTTRIAYVGHDYGATFGAIVAGVDTKIKGFALEAGTPRITEWYMYGSASGVPSGEDAKQFVNSFKTMEPDAMITKTKSQVLLQYSLNDQYISTERVQDMKKAAPKNTVLKTYNTTHAMDLPQVISDRREWLMQLLNLKTP